MKSRGRFKKLFLSYLVVVLIPILLINLIYLLVMSDKIENDTKEAALSNMRDLSAGVETLLNNVEELTIQLSLMPSLNRLLSDPFSADPYDYALLKEDLRNFILPNQLFHSMYIYFKLSDKVLTTNEGFYNHNDFYDKTLLDEAIANEKHYEWYATRQLMDNQDTGKVEDVITFTRALPLTGKYALGDMVVNMREDIFFDVLNKMNNNRFSDIFVVDGQGRIIVHKDRQYLYKPVDDMYFSIDGLSQNEGIKAVTMNDQRYYAVYLKAQYNGWTYISLIPYQVLSAQLYEQSMNSIKIIVLMFFLGFILSYIFSQKMYMPWKQLLIKIGAYLPNKDNNESGDEYNMVDRVLDELIGDNREIKARMEQNKPIVRDRLISDLLWNNAYDLAYISEMMDYTGIKFVYSHFIAAIAVINEVNITDNSRSVNDIKLYICSIIEQIFDQEFYTLAVALDDDRVAFIINAQYDGIDADLQQKLKAYCAEVNSIIKKQLHLSLCFSFGSICNDVIQISDSFRQAKKELNYRAVMDEEAVLFIRNTSEIDFLYPLSLQRQVINAVKSRDKRLAGAAIEGLFSQYVYVRKYSYDKLQQMIIMFISAVLSELWQEGLNLGKMADMNIFTSIEKCKSSRELEQFMYNYFYELINTHEALLAKQADNIYISKAIEFVEQNYNRDISVNDIAEYVHLNPTYLGRIFKRHIGKTLTEYLTAYRMQKGKELLKNSRLSLQEISSTLGYNDVHSFIRFFKKYEGITPGEYRSTLVEKTTPM